MPSLEVAEGQCVECKKSLFLLPWNKGQYLVICENSGCVMYHTPAGHVERSESKPEPVVIDGRRRPWSEKRRQKMEARRLAHQS